MVSDNLFAFFYFRVVLSILVLLQQGVCLGFTIRFRKLFMLRTYLTCLFILVACMGWIITVSCDPKGQGMYHAAGAGIFVVGTCGYYVGMMSLARSSERGAGLSLIDLFTMLSFVLASLLALIYVVVWFSHPNEAWIPENLAFVFSEIGYLLFFYTHDFDPFVPLKLSLSQECVNYPNQCMPLLDLDDFY
jgi:hypothetical protein